MEYLLPAENNPLRRLVLVDTVNSGDFDFLARCPNLQELNLIGSNHQQIGWAVGPLCGNLHNLSLGGWGKCSESSHPNILTLQAISRGCTKLTSLSLPGCYEIGDTGLSDLVLANPNLTYLDIDGCTMITDDFWRLMTGSGLEVISCRVKATEKSISICTNESLRIFATMPRLRELHMDRCSVTVGLHHLFDCTALRELTISRCAGFTDEWLAGLVASKVKLHTLDMQHCTWLSGNAIVAFQKVYPCKLLCSLAVNTPPPKKNVSNL
jgi:hypothetical protein